MKSPKDKSILKNATVTNKEELLISRRNTIKLSILNGSSRGDTVGDYILEGIKAEW